MPNMQMTIGIGWAIEEQMLVRPCAHYAAFHKYLSPANSEGFAVFFIVDYLALENLFVAEKLFLYSYYKLDLLSCLESTLKKAQYS